MKDVFILLCLPLCFGVALNHKVSDNLMIGNISQIDNVVDSALSSSFSSHKFDMTALISTLTDLSVDPVAMLNVITLLTHMIYEASSTIDQIRAEVATETENMEIATNEAGRVVNDANREAGEIRGDAQGLLDAAVARRDSESPVLQGEVSMLYSVIATLGGDDLNCLNGRPADSCGNVWSDRIETDTVDECLRSQRALHENSIDVLGVMHRQDNGACFVYDIQRFDQCSGISWHQSDFVPDVFVTCRLQMSLHEQEVDLGAECEPPSSSGILVGSNFIQIGEWRLGDVDGQHFSVAHEGGSTAMIYRSDGTLHPGPRSDYTTWGRPLTPSGVYFGYNFVQIGEWRLGDVDGQHFSVAHQGGMTAMIYRSDGTIHPGPRSDYTTYDRELNPHAANAGFGDRTLQIGSWRFGDVNGNHASITHVDGYTATIFRGDGTIHNGPRQDWTTNDRSIIGVCGVAPTSSPTSSPTESPTASPALGRQQPRMQCMVNTAEFNGDNLGNPIFGGGGFVGSLTLDECRARCQSSVDSHGRNCVAIEWSDGGESLAADAQRNCALAWGCDYVQEWGGGSVYQIWGHQQPQMQCMVNTAEFNGDNLGNPIFGGGGFVGSLTLDECRARCGVSVDSHDRSCVAIEWSDGGESLAADARRNCALAWGCDYVHEWSGGSVYQM